MSEEESGFPEVIRDLIYFVLYWPFFLTPVWRGRKCIKSHTKCRTHGRHLRQLMMCWNCVSVNHPTLLFWNVSLLAFLARSETLVCQIMLPRPEGQPQLGMSGRARIWRLHWALPGSGGDHEIPKYQNCSWALLCIYYMGRRVFHPWYTPPLSFHSLYSPLMANFVQTTPLQREDETI